MIKPDTNFIWRPLEKSWISSHGWRRKAVNFFYIKNRAENNLNQFRSEIMEIFSMGYDAVHLHTSYWKTFELEMLAKKAGIPRIIIHSHNTAVFDDNGREEKERQHYKLAEMLTADMGTDFWACSQKAAEWLYTDKIPEEKIVIMRNGVDAEKFAYSSAVREEYRSRLNWEDKYVIGHVGRFPIKNHEFLINVFREIEKINKNARLLLIGKGPLEAEIRLMVQRYDLSEKVRFAGACEDVDGWLQAMDLFCLPSRFEGFPHCCSRSAGRRSSFDTWRGRYQGSKFVWESCLCAVADRKLGKRDSTRDEQGS